MKLVLKTSGGLAALRVEGVVDTEKLPPQLARKVEEVLTPERLRLATSGGPRVVRRASPASSWATADANQYELMILPEDGDDEVERYLVEDACEQYEVLDVIDDLVQEILRGAESKR